MESRLLIAVKALLTRALRGIGIMDFEENPKKLSNRAEICWPRLMRLRDGPLALWVVSC
jgi:hypothetical protein